MQCLFYLILLVFFSYDIQSHGFSESTTVVMNESNRCYSIRQLAVAIKENKTKYVITYDQAIESFSKGHVKAAGVSETNCYCVLSFDDDSCHNIVCTPSQQFYRIADRQWVEAYMLKNGDVLLCDNNKTIELKQIVVTGEKLKVYTIEVKDTHTFLVGFYRIVTHNMFVPIAASLGLSIPFSTGCGGTLGVILGPVGLIGGIVFGGIIGCVVGTYMKEGFSKYTLSFKVDAIESIVNNNKEYRGAIDSSNDAQAPGKPTERDGFVPKKSWGGEKVKHRRGYGWPDKKGSIWIPTGPNGHGGPHWDVQHPDGSYDNIVPGGGIRGKK